ncbi:hypothetical protein [Streptomyces sp. TRM64462]|uniref:hypothetical protein n=1 Tax=Streptomyces sp. TRM64462 TaxID=2741726 RepID=UPI002815F6C3|nr:hypothetical protein [Streptomyces sp. TRM64462]
MSTDARRPQPPGLPPEPDVERTTRLRPASVTPANGTAPAATASAAAPATTTDGTVQTPPHANAPAPTVPRRIPPRPEHRPTASEAARPANPSDTDRRPSNPGAPAAPGTRGPAAPPAGHVPAQPEPSAPTAPAGPSGTAAGATPRTASADTLQAAASNRLAGPARPTGAGPVPPEGHRASGESAPSRASGESAPSRTTAAPGEPAAARQGGVPGPRSAPGQPSAPVGAVGPEGPGARAAQPAAGGRGVPAAPWGEPGRAVPPQPYAHQGFGAWAPPEAPAETTTRLRPIRERRTGRTVAAVTSLVLGLGLIGGAAAGAWLLRDSGDQPARTAYTEAATLWHSTPVDTLFPRTLKGDGAGPGGADRTWTRVAVAPDAPCASALHPGLAQILDPAGCLRVLRATYTDATATSVTTVGLVFMDSDAPGMTALHTRFTDGGLDRRPDLIPPALPAPGTVAAGFGNPQRASWHIDVLTEVPVVVFAVSGFADGRSVTTPQPAQEAMVKGQTTAPAQAGLGHDARGVADRIEHGLREAVTAAVDPEKAQAEKGATAP